jgi:hypothetical protein
MTQRRRFIREKNCSCEPSMRLYPRTVLMQAGIALRRRRRDAGWPGGRRKGCVGGEKLLKIAPWNLADRTKLDMGVLSIGKGLLEPCNTLEVVASPSTCWDGTAGSC